MQDGSTFYESLMRFVTMRTTSSSSIPNVSFFRSCLCRRVSPSGQHRVLHEQGQGIDLRVCSQSTWTQGTLGRPGGQDHHDRNPYCNAVAYLRWSQGLTFTNHYSDYTLDAQDYIT